MENKKILVLCGGKYAFPALQQLGMEKFLCGIAIGKGEPELVEMLETVSSKDNFAFQSFKDKESLAGLRSWIDEIQPDYIFSISFPFLLSEEVLAYGEDKFINFHPGPLPQYRGPMPLFEVLRYQEKETAISVHFMNKEFDEGALILKEQVPVKTNDTYGTLAVKLSERTASVASNLAHMLQFASVIPREEQDSNEARYFENPEFEDTFIQWNRMPAELIVSLINACNPWNQGADAVLNGQPVKLLTASVYDEKHESASGTILELTEDSGMKVACMNNQVIHVGILSSDFGIMTPKQYSAIKKIEGFRFN